MKIKLIKVEQDYYLVCKHKHIPHGFTAFEIEGTEYYFIATTSSKTKDDNEMKKLSLKNCQAIERGYDLDELAASFIGVPMMYYDENDVRVWNAVKYSFQKALEILGDKKFSEEDVKKIIHWSTLDKDVRLSEEELFQSLQQSEWEVEVEMCIEYTEGGYPVRGNTPKLDATGCLILKRI